MTLKQEHTVLLRLFSLLEAPLPTSIEQIRQDQSLSAGVMWESNERSVWPPVECLSLPPAAPHPIAAFYLTALTTYCGPLHLGSSHAPSVWQLCVMQA